MTRSESLSFQAYAIEVVNEQESQYEVKYDVSLVTYLPKVEGLPAPRVGEMVQIYGLFGFQPSRIAVNGRVYFRREEVRDR